MKKINKRLLVLLFVVFVILGCPSDQKFAERLHQDYGYSHGQNLSIDQLREMGSSRYQSYILFSTYNYKFGSISVSYWGAGFMTFSLQRTKPKSKKIHQENNTSIS